MDNKTRYIDFLSLTAGIVSGVALIICARKAIYKWYNKKIDPTCVKPTLAVIVRGDAKMSFGKQLAQICHAGLSVYIKMLKKNPKVLKQWKEDGKPVILAKVSTDGENKLQEIRESAQSLNIITELISDAGHTQIAPGTLTALGIGPASIEDIYKICEDVVFEEKDIDTYDSLIECSVQFPDE